MSDEYTPAVGDPTTGAEVRPATGGRRGIRSIAAVVAVVVVAVAAVAVAAGIALRGGEASADSAGGGGRDGGADHFHNEETEAATADGSGGRGTADRLAGRGHRHDPLPPYDERYADATDGERQAADDLLDDVRSTLAAYADVDAAVAAGYQAPRRPRGHNAHYLDPSVATDGRVLDPSRPNGLVYRTGGGGDPVLVGAFFVAPPGTPAPMPAGDLVVWHSHSPTCPAFFASADEPCVEARFMLHVWTVDQVELVGRSGQAIGVEIVDPFGAPFRASVAPVA